MTAPSQTGANRARKDSIPSTCVRYLAVQRKVAIETQADSADVYATEAAEGRGAEDSLPPPGLSTPSHPGLRNDGTLQNTNGTKRVVRFMYAA